MSSFVHLAYGLYIFSTAVAGDLSQAVSDLLFKPNVDAALKKEGSSGTTNADDLPPIVLVHGIFGFGKGVCFYQFNSVFTFILSFVFFC